MILIGHVSLQLHDCTREQSMTCTPEQAPAQLLADVWNHHVHGMFDQPLQGLKNGSWDHSAAAMEANFDKNSLPI